MTMFLQEVCHCGEYQSESEYTRLIYLVQKGKITTDQLQMSDLNHQL